MYKKKNNPVEYTHFSRITSFNIRTLKPHRYTQHKNNKKIKTRPGTVRNGRTTISRSWSRKLTPSSLPTSLPRISSRRTIIQSSRRNAWLSRWRQSSAIAARAHGTCAFLSSSIFTRRRTHAWASPATATWSLGGWWRNIASRRKHRATT